MVGILSGAVTNTPGLVTDTGMAFAVEELIPIHVQQVINGSKVTDHHALLPTKSIYRNFNLEETT